MRIFCFSGSGNSYSVAKDIGTHFSTKPELITHFKEKSVIEATEPQIGIIAPVHLDDIPKVVKEFILKLSFADPDTYVFTVLTSSSGKSKKGLKNVSLALAQHGMRLALAYYVQMPSSFQERADLDSILGAVPEKVAEIINAIEARRENYGQHSSALLPKGFTKLSIMHRPISRMAVTEKCAGCGLCCSLCPTNNIKLQNGKAVRGKDCIACTACANWCPQYAISSRRLIGQYRHPEVSAADLLIT